MTKKVSVITPCLNGERFLDRYFNSILNQNYKNLELIFINDGSTDKTDEIVKSFIPKFEKENIDFIYINKKSNEGQAKAIDEALKIFTGDYFIWPDSDDILHRDSIKKRVEFLEQRKEYGMVRSNADVVDESDINKVLYRFETKTVGNEYIFDDVVLENIYMCPGCYMIRSEAFFKVNKNKSIYCGQSGQNWQIVLPIVYSYKCGYIDESLYTYVIRKNSHSRNTKTLEEVINRSYEHQKTLSETIKRIDMDDCEYKKYSRIIEEKYFKIRLMIGHKFNDKKTICENYKLLNEKYIPTRNETYIYLLNKSKISNIIIRIYIKIGRLLGIKDD